MPDPHITAIDGFQCFPMDTDDRMGHRVSNLTEWWGKVCREGTKRKSLKQGALFNDVYAILFHPSYRASFAEILRKQVPRIPIPAEPAGGAQDPEGALKSRKASVVEDKEGGAAMGRASVARYLDARHEAFEVRMP